VCGVLVVEVVPGSNNIVFPCSQLGINVLDDALRRSYEVQLRVLLPGVLVVEVVPGSPAAAAGLRPARFRGADVDLGDLITHVDGEPTRQVR